MEFEWDEAKNNVNIQKHGIDFTDATLIFDNPALIYEDLRRNYGERRFCGIGMLYSITVSLIYTKRENKIRIISARRAREDERKKYKKLYEGYHS